MPSTSDPLLRQVHCVWCRTTMALWRYLTHQPCCDPQGPAS